MIRLFLISSLIPALLTAQARSTGFSFLKIPTTARSASMGESNLADLSRLPAWTSNPALLAVAKAPTVSLSHVEWIQDVQTEFFSVSLPLSFASFGVSVSSTAVRGIEVRDRPGPALGSFDARATSMGAAVGIPLDKNIRLGGSLRYIYEKLYVDESIGFGFDAGLLVSELMEGGSGAVTLTNLGAANNMRNQSASLPSALTVAAAYEMIAGDTEITATAAYSTPLHGGVNRLHIGAEGRYDMFALRAGYQTGYESRGLSVGFGGRHGIISFDYAFLPFSFGLGNAHLAALTFEL